MPSNVNRRPALHRLETGKRAIRLGELVNDFIPSGYENNEGGQGVVRINLETGEVEVDHEYNLTEVVSKPRSFQLNAKDYSA